MKKLFLLLALLSAGLASAQVVPPGSATNPFNAGISVPGCTINAVVYIDASGNLACGGAPAPNYDATNIRLQVGTGTTTQSGVQIGYTGTSQYGGIWPTGVTPTISNYALLVNGASQNTYISGASLTLAASATSKATINSTAGSGFNITAGTATTAVQSLSTTQTWNAAGVTFTGHKYTVTDTASAAGSLHSQWLGGAAGATTLMSLSKAGQLVVAPGSTAAPTISASDAANSGIWFNSGYAQFNNAPSSWVMGLGANPSNGLVINSLGYMGFTSGTVFGAGDTFFMRDAAAVMQMGADVNGAAVAQTLKAHDGITGTDIAGANLTLAAGRGTGAGTAGNLRIQTAVPVTTGTTAQILADRELFVGKPRSVADNTATTLFTITLGDDTDGGGIVDFCSRATSATTDRQKTCGQIAFSGVDVTAGAGGETCSAAITGTNNTSVSVGTLTVTAAATTGTDLCNIQITSDSSLNVAHLIQYSVRLHPSASTVVITPQ